MEHLYEKAQESAEYIRAHIAKRPKIAEQASDTMCRWLGAVIPKM